MNKYYNNFMKYAKLTEQDFEEFTDVIDCVNDNLISLDKDKISGHAVVLLGYSGNGKSTFVNKFISTNPNYESISMDSVEKKLVSEKGLGNYTGFDVVRSFGDRLCSLIDSGKNVIIDGNFLNLFTRSGLTDTLHEYGYYVTLVDLRSIFDKTIKNRIFDLTSLDMGIKISEENVFKYLNNPIFIKRYNHIMNYHKHEKEHAFVDLQEEYKCFGMGVEEVVDYNYKGGFNEKSKK